MDLTELGLTKNETKVFRALVRLGKASSSLVSKESGVSYSVIYNVLASLENKGLVKVIPEKGKKFVPADPSVLKELIKKKRKSLDLLEDEVNKLKQLYDIKEKEPVELARGKRNFYKLIRNLPKPKKSELNVKYTSEFQPEWVRMKKSGIKKGVLTKDLVRVDKETISNVKKWLKINKNIRRIKNEGVAFSIVDNSAVLISLIKSNTMLLIKDVPFIKLMKELFEGYYKNAESIIQ